MILGYFLALQFGNYNVLNLNKATKTPWMVWAGRDQFCIASDLTKDPVLASRASIRLNASGSDQELSLKDMTHSISEQVVYITKYMSLEKGDILLTGSPFSGHQVQTGDSVSGELLVEGVSVAQASAQIMDTEM